MSASEHRSTPEHDQTIAISPTLSVTEDDIRDRGSPSESTEELLAGLNDFTPLLPMWMSSSFYEARLKPLLSYNGPGNKFSLSDIPGSAQWGDGDLHNLLCYGNRPLIILAAGELQMFGAAVDSTSMVSSTRMRVELFRDIDRASSSALILRSRGVPVTAQPLLEASRIDRRSGNMFTHVVDATECWPPSLPSIAVPLSDLAIGDVVLMETALIRDDRTAALSYPTWQQYACKFMLCSVALLARAPRGAL